jgi:uncharacterized protein YndB with AHSA1/START domain
MAEINFNIDPHLDLVFERSVAFSPAELWKAWTTPELLQEWFCPRPWGVSEVEMDVRAGGIFRTVMLSPEGQRFPNLGAFLHVETGRRLVWTNAVLPEFRARPVPKEGESLDFAFSCDLNFIPTEEGCLYHCIVRHADVQGKEQHEAMGFQEGWGMAFDQLIEVLVRLRG